MKIFLVSILIISFVNLNVYAVNVDDKDWAALQTSYTQYKNSYNRMLFNYNTMTNAMSKEVLAQQKVIAIYSNQLKQKDKELIIEKVEKYTLLGMVLAVLVRLGVAVFGGK